MNTIAILIPYFGEWPPWFDIFLETCRHNPSVDWVFFTNDKEDIDSIDNVYIHSMTLEEFSQRASRTLELSIDVKRPYKVCDFRPAFAEIFESEIQGYDFWGWGDTDVLYGKLRKFFTEDRLSKYDIFGLRRYRTSGVLTILRNNKYINSLYKKSKDYRRVFTGDEGYAFDEVGIFNDRRVESFTHIVKKERDKGGAKVLFWEPIRTDKNITNPFRYYWKNGSIYDMEYGSEFALYHFVDRKEDPSFRIPSNVDISKGFYVSDDGIQEADKSQDVDVRLFPLIKKRVLERLRRIKHRLEGVV